MGSLAPATAEPITLHSHSSGPNPWKVAILMEELGLRYRHEFHGIADLKKPPYEKLNPNGRVPCIEDPNTGMLLWESGAIIEYLIDTYDHEQRFSFASSPDKYYAKQFLHYQMSGQGPYYGQAAWFANFHPEKIPSAVERYRKEIRRVVKVLDGILIDKEYLVGDKCSYADLAFIPWSTLVPSLLGGVEKDEIARDAPHYNAWMDKLTARPAVKKVLEEKAEAMATVPS
ncbi:MAG: hypothetical protein Q9220_003674 [cf. Caloplaca sp. 1 TL-2023]